MRKALIKTVILSFCFIGIINKSFAKEYENIIEKQFKCTQSTTLNITNIYGDINVKRWDKADVFVKAIVVVTTANKKKAERFFDEFDIKMYQTRGKIVAKTQIPRNLEKGKQFKVSYEVRIPQYLKMNITNKFGNLFIETLSAPSNITLSYGELKGGDFVCAETYPKSTIRLSYAKATINECNNAKLNMDYSKVSINKSNSLSVVSKYSRLNLLENENITIDSKYDIFNIGTTGDIVVNMAERSQFNVDNVKRKVAMNIRYGKFAIAKVDEEFSSIKIDNKYATGRIGIGLNTSYFLKAQTKNSNIFYPQESRVLERNTIQQETSLRVLVGDRTMNNGKRVDIATENGDINLY